MNFNFKKYNNLILNLKNYIDLNLNLKNYNNLNLNLKIKKTIKQFIRFSSYSKLIILNILSLVKEYLIFMIKIK